MGQSESHPEWETIGPCSGKTDFTKMSEVVGAYGIFYTHTHTHTHTHFQVGENVSK